MAIKRVVDTSFWTDGKVDDFTPEDKYFMLYLLTNPFTTQLGIYELSIKQAAFQLGYSIDAVKSLIDRFENKYEMILFSKSTNEVAIKNFLKHSIIKGGAPVKVCILKEMKQVKNKDLISAVFSSIKEIEDLNYTIKDIIAEYEKNEGKTVDDAALNDTCHVQATYGERTEDVQGTYEARTGGNDNDNDNENEKDNIIYSIFDDSPKPEKNTKKEVRHKYGEYSNVLLSDSDMEKLKAEFPNDYQGRIENLSAYMASTGKSYKNHLATIRNWAKKDAQKETETGYANDGYYSQQRRANIKTWESLQKRNQQQADNGKDDGGGEPKKFQIGTVF